MVNHLLLIGAAVSFLIAGYYAKAPQVVYQPVAKTTTKTTKYNGGRK